MKMKSVATCSPMLLCLVAGAAHADLEPFSFEASESVRHQSNVLHGDDSGRVADWLSTTELRAALDQQIGREQLKAAASVNADRYSKLHTRNSEGYSASGELDWSTIGDLSGALGADSRRRQYLYGLDGDQASGAKNLETDNHAFARVMLGGMARWSIFSGFDASERKFSDPTFAVNEVQQWAVSGGTNYATSPDLSFGLNGRYIHGKYPKVLLGGEEEAFSVKTLGVNTKWAASANSAFDANVGYTRQRTDGQSDQNYINGGLNWHWTPPGHFTFTLGASRDSNTAVGQGSTITNTNSSINARSLNTSAHFDVTYQLTAKVSFDADVAYIHRKYSDALLPTGLIFNGQPVLQPASGASNTARFALFAHYAPTRTTSVACGFSREAHKTDHSIRSISVPYTDNTVQCSASIRFE